MKSKRKRANRFSAKNKKDYLMYTGIAIAIVLVLGVLFLFNNGTFENSVETEPQVSDSSGQVSVTVLPPGEEEASPEENTEAQT